MRGVIVRDFLLDLDKGGGFVGEFRGLHEVGVDLGKIHRGKIELLELEVSAVSTNGTELRL